MTLLAARARASAAVQAAATSWRAGHERPVVNCVAADGPMSTDEIMRRSVRLPTAQVAVMGRNEDGHILVGAWVITRTRAPARDEDLSLVDAIEEALRTLLGAGRPLLKARTRQMYDPDLVKAGSAAVWIVSTALPSLIGDAPDSGDTGLLHALDELLATRLGEGGLGWRWASTEPQRDRLVLDGELPFALVIYGGDGELEQVPAGVVGYESGGTEYLQELRGRRIVVATVELLGRTEEEVETALDVLLRSTPLVWTYQNVQWPVRVRRVVGAHWRRREGAHATVAEVALAAGQAAGDPEPVQTAGFVPPLPREGPE